MSRPELVDEHGTHHRAGCPMPGWACTTAARAGVHVLRCPTCGAVRLVLAARRNTPTTPEPTTGRTDERTTR